MGHDTNQQTGCSTTTIVLAVVAAMALFFLVLAIGVGALFYVRVGTAKQHAIVAREQAVKEAERARNVAEEVRAQAEAERERAEALATELQSDKNSPITLKISKEGDVTLNGEPVGVDDLQAKLAAEQGKSVVIEAHPDCLFARVAELLAICKEAEIEGVQVSTNQRVMPEK